jgi:KUP system potassium uptake protein
MHSKNKLSKVTAAGVLITFGIIFGDIGTSPLYVLSAIIGEAKVTEQLVYGSISCIVWTLTLQTTMKYIILTLQADNKGEGGIFSLYALVRRYRNWLRIPAIIGAGTLLADGIITPPISVSSAIEGLRIFNPHIATIPIVLIILTMLFAFQRWGTRIVGGSFGPIMVCWFLMIAVFGTIEIMNYPFVLKAVNPWYAYDLLVHYPQGFWLLGAVFLCTTGAEALYSDLGHCGKGNIRVAWIFVKTSLLLNYFGQGAFIISNLNGRTLGGINPFFEMMPSWFVIPGIVIATLATIIASQALISGSFTLISEAMRLNFWPKVTVLYPTELRGQIYVPSINWLLWIGCVLIQLYFKESANMAAAYGFSITIAMMMTSILLMYYLIFIRKIPTLLGYAVLVIFLSAEISFLVANSPKLLNRLGILVFEWGLISMMLIWFAGRKLKNIYTEYIPFKDHLPVLKDLSEDVSIPKYASNIVYLTKSISAGDIESKIIYSIFKKSPKRADIYWFVHIHTRDEPYTTEYIVDELIKDIAYRIEFRIGFKVLPKVNLFLRKAIEEMTERKEISIISRYRSLQKYALPGDFKFVLLEKALSLENVLSLKQDIILKIYFLIDQIALSDKKSFGLNTSDVVTEMVPLLISGTPDVKMQRISFHKLKTVIEDHSV